MKLLRRMFGSMHELRAPEAVVEKVNLMKTAVLPEKSLLELFADLRDESKELVRQEIELAKTEISEKISRMARNAAFLAVGGLIAYAGLIVFLMGLGLLLSWAFQKVGLSPSLGNFVGAAIIGFLTTAVGAVLLFKELRNLAQESLAPEKTVHTIKEFRHGDAAPATARYRPAAAKPSSGEIETLIGSTQKSVKQTAAELRQRLTFRYLAKQFVVHLKQHPVRSGLLAAGSSCAGFFLVKRRWHHAR